MRNNCLAGENIINIINDFYADGSSESAVPNLLKTICSICNINKVTTMARNNNNYKYLKVYEYDINKGFNNFLADLDMKSVDFVNVLNYNKDIIAEQFIDCLKGKNYIYGDDFSEIKENLYNVGFKSDNENDIKEFYVFLVGTAPELFTYYVFEKYSDNKLTNIEVDLITMLCETINIRLINVIRESKYKNELLMRDVVIDSEKIPMVTVDKVSNKVLLFNKFFGKSEPDTKTGEISEKINSIIEEFNGNKNKTILLDDDEYNQQWLRKVIPFKLSTGKDAYMIYSKDSTDYVNQINAVDELTDAILIKGFEEYYNSFVRRSSNNYALCTIDIDKFKYINTTFGYDMGDSVLKKVSVVIRDFIDNEEIYCRLGEDKFSIFIHYEDDMHLHLKLRSLLGRFEIMRDEYFIDTKITIVGGVTVIDKKLPLNIILDQSTMARKSVKGSLKNTFSYYNIDLDLKLQKEIQLEEQIPHAIANDEFVPFLQPKFTMDTKTICGAEALVRWITPKGMVFPDQFIPLFEKNGFILTLDFIIYEKVMKYIRETLDKGFKVYPISVNVSRNHIKDELFIDKFMGLIDKYNVPCEYLELEVTESVFVEDRKELKLFIDKIKEQNLKVSIDDFGTAYSSLQTLTDINVDILKIDKGFIDNIGEDLSTDKSKDIILIKNIVNLAKDLEFSVICEGVETDEQIEFLKEIGCELGQGYVFARPMPIDDYEKQFITVNN